MDMFLIKIHKWIVSLAIIAGVVTFSGYTSSNVPLTYENTELVIEKPISKTSVYYFIASKNSSSLITDGYKFSFQSFIRNYNSTTSLQIKTGNYKALQYFDAICCKELLRCLNQDDYHNIFIG